MKKAMITATAAAGMLQPSAGIESLFLEWVKFLDVAPATVRTYKKGMKAFISFLVAHGIKKPAREDVLAFKDALKESHKPATVQSYLTAVKLFFQWLAASGRYDDVAAHVKGVKIAAGFKKSYLTAGQAKRLLAGIDRSTLAGKRDYAMLLLMLSTGLRTVSVARANIEDVKPAGDSVALYHQGKGRTDKTEYVKLSEPVETAINEYLTARGKAAAGSPLFVAVSNHNYGGRMPTESISRICKTRLRAAGFNSDLLTAHSLRHTAATLNLLAGGTIEETQQLLGHKNINTTMIYSHALERARNQSESRITAAILSA